MGKEMPVMTETDIAAIAARLRRVPDRDTGSFAQIAEALLALNDRKALRALTLELEEYRPARWGRGWQPRIDDAIQAGGWSGEEILDDAIPRFGLDQTGRRAFGEGAAAWTVIVDPDGPVFLDDAAGKRIAGPKKAHVAANPGPKEQARALAGAITAAAPGIRRSEAARLADAMGSRRRWPAGDWCGLLLHPMMRPVMRGLVWLAETGQESRAAFRPLEDGSFTKADDAFYDLPPDAVVSLAHAALLDETDSAAWRAHLADYGVEAPFSQFNPVPCLAEGTDAVTAFEGHRVPFGLLDSRLKKCGYARAKNLGYEKELAGGARIRACWHGERQPAPWHEVALDRAEIDPAPGAPEESRRVLLCLAWDDLAALAALGTGRPEDWKTATAT
jgi:hypothetical protein